MTGFKDLSECGRVSHSNLKIYQHNGKYKLSGLNTCKKPCCPNCLPKLLLKQKKLIDQAISYARVNNLATSMWTINLPKSSNTSLMFMRSKLHSVISDFLRVSTRNSKDKPINKVLKKINLQTQSVGYVYRNEISTDNKKFNPHVQLLDFRKNFLTSEQEESLAESLIEICVRNKIFISKKQSFKVHDVIIDFKHLTFDENQNSYNYLTKIDDNDAIRLSETNREMYEELCKSQILLNRKSNEKVIKIPLIYWQPKLKKKMGITEEKFSVTDEDFS